MIVESRFNEIIPGDHILKDRHADTCMLERGGDCARGARSEEATARAGRGARRQLRARGGERGGDCARGARSEAATALPWQETLEASETVSL